MLGSLTGIVTARLENRILIDIQGVGYWVFTGSWQPSGNVTVYLYHHTREDMSDLYGFESLPALTLFEKLISISGIGPKAALALLSLGSIDQIAGAIARQDTAYLSSAPGIGSKAAQKIVLELHNKVNALASSPDSLQIGNSDIRDALEGLGYRTNEAQLIINQMPPELTTLDTQLKWALQQLSK